MLRVVGITTRSVVQLWLNTRGVLGVWIAYFVIDLSILLLAGLSLRVGMLFIVSLAMAVLHECPKR